MSLIKLSEVPAQDDFQAFGEAPGTWPGRFFQKKNCVPAGRQACSSTTGRFYKWKTKRKVAFKYGDNPEKVLIGEEMNGSVLLALAGFLKSSSAASFIRLSVFSLEISRKGATIL